MTDPFLPSALLNDYLSTTFKNYDKPELDHSRVPLATAITSNFMNASDERTISEYESLHLDFFLICVSYMRGHTSYVDGRDSPRENGPKISYDIRVLIPSCFIHSSRDDNRLMSKLRRMDRDAQKLALDTVKGIPSVKKFQPRLYEAMMKSIEQRTCKRFVPIFGTFFANVRSDDVPSSGPKFVKQHFATTYCTFTLEVACSSCQTERFFCNLYEKDVKTPSKEKENDNDEDDVFVEMDDSEEIEKEYFKGKKRIARSSSVNERPKKRFKNEARPLEFGSTTTSNEEENVDIEIGSCERTVEESDAVFEEIPEEIWNRILNMLLFDHMRTRIRAFRPEKDTLGSVTNYVSVYKNANAAKNADLGEFVENVDEPYVLHQSTENVLKNTVLSEENATENMVLDDLNGLLDFVRSVSSVCKSWNDRVKKHWCWRYVYQCSHTLYNSSRIEVTREFALSAKALEASEIDKRTQLYRLSKRVHGLFDCHVFASYTFNILSGVLFETINASVYKNKTDYKFRKHRVYHSLVRLICVDTFRNWNDTQTANREFEFLLESCYDGISAVLKKTKFATENVKIRLDGMLALASNNISIEKKINATC